MKAELQQALDLVAKHGSVRAASKASCIAKSTIQGRYNKAKELLAESLLINEWDGYSLEMEDLFLPSYMTKQALENDFN